MTSLISFLIDYKAKIQLGFLIAIFISFFFPGHAVESISILSFSVFSLILAFYLPINILDIKFQSIWFITYLLMLLSGFWAQDYSLFFDKIILKTPIIAIPFCFIWVDKFSKINLRIFSYFLVTISILALLYVSFNYQLNAENILLNIKSGHPIPVPFRSHIRFTILLYFCWLISLYHFDLYDRLQEFKLKFIWVFITILLTGFILFLAVKIGLVLIVFSALFYIVFKTIEAKRFSRGILGLGMFALVLYGVILFTPTLSAKLSYFWYDLSRLNATDANNYSDSGRLNSILKGIEVIRSHFWLGVGEGNVVHFIHAESIANARLPHNQFIIAWAQNGILGICIFTTIFVFAFFKGFKSGNWPLMIYISAMFIACSIEPMLETQLGVALFTIPIFILHSFQFQENK